MEINDYFIYYNVVIFYYFQKRKKKGEIGSFDFLFFPLLLNI